MIIKPRQFRKPRKGHWATKGLKFLMLGNEGSGNKVFDLASGNTGIMSGSLWVPGKFGSAIIFDGDTDTINFGKFTGFDGVSAFSIVMTLMWNVYTGSYDVVLSQNAGSSNSVIINGDGTGGVLTFNVSNGTNAYGSLNPFQTAGRYYHIVLVYDGSGAANADRLKLYIDGIYTPFNSFTGTIPATVPVLSSADFILGFAHASFCFDGVMDNFSIYNRGLSVSEIAELYWRPFGMFERDSIELWVGATSVGVAPVGIAAYTHHYQQQL